MHIVLRAVKAIICAYTGIPDTVLLSRIKPLQISSVGQLQSRRTAGQTVQRNVEISRQRCVVRRVSERQPIFD